MGLALNRLLEANVRQNNFIECREGWMSNDPNDMMTVSLILEEWQAHGKFQSHKPGSNLPEQHGGPSILSAMGQAKRASQPVTPGTGRAEAKGDSVHHAVKRKADSGGLVTKGVKVPGGKDWRNPDVGRHGQRFTQNGQAQAMADFDDLTEEEVEEYYRSVGHVQPVAAPKKVHVEEPVIEERVIRVLEDVPAEKVAASPPEEEHRKILTGELSAEDVIKEIRQASAAGIPPDWAKSVTEFVERRMAEEKRKADVENERKLRESNAGSDNVKAILAKISELNDENKEFSIQMNIQQDIVTKAQSKIEVLRPKIKARAAQIAELKIESNQITSGDRLLADQEKATAYRVAEEKWQAVYDVLGSTRTASRAPVSLSIRDTREVITPNMTEPAWAAGLPEDLPFLMLVKNRFLARDHVKTTLARVICDARIRQVIDGTKYRKNGGLTGKLRKAIKGKIDGFKGWIDIKKCLVCWNTLVEVCNINTRVQSADTDSVFEAIGPVFDSVTREILRTDPQQSWAALLVDDTPVRRGWNPAVIAREIGNVAADVVDNDLSEWSMACKFADGDVVEVEAQSRSGAASEGARPGVESGSPAHNQAGNDTETVAASNRVVVMEEVSDTEDDTLHIEVDPDVFNEVEAEVSKEAKQGSQVRSRSEKASYQARRRNTPPRSPRSDRRSDGRSRSRDDRGRYERHDRRDYYHDGRRRRESDMNEDRSSREYERRSRAPQDQFLARNR